MLHLLGEIFFLLSVGLQFLDAAMKILDALRTLRLGFGSFLRGSIHSRPLRAVASLQLCRQRLKIVDAIRIALLGGQPVPAQRLAKVRRHAQPMLVHPADLVLRVAVALTG